MKLVVKQFKSLPCRLEVFTINGNDANYDDFGNMHDHDTKSIEPYTCVDMYFEPKHSTKEVLEKYNITEKEYDTICYELEGELHVGSCECCF